MNDKPRLIDANSLKRGAYPFPCAIGVEYAVTIRQINEAPTIDAVPVVRCKDCGYSSQDERVIRGKYWCGCHGQLRCPDDYCNEGYGREKHD